MAINSNESMRIFVGIDCFGRGCPGGGGFNTKEALELVVKASESFSSRPLSVALFAPAWSFEKREELLHLVDCTPVSDDACALASAVYRLDRRFWRPLTPLLSRLRAVGSQSRHLYRPSCPWRGSITTNFSLGMGLFDTNGVRLKPWSQLAGQEVLPTCRAISATQGKDEQAGFDVEVIPEFVEYYLPGNSLRLSISRIDADTKNLFLELFVFPNLSLSSVANLTIILKFESEKGPVKVFADICIVSWESVYVAEEYSVTGRKYINCSGE
uniref:Mannosyl-glycoprotein endo-beta-N-acetylglucosaminidase n=1 Tax=Mesocestoides corti TaxID=53468 RepID=A0A5K3G5M6_MESCO